MIFSIQLELTLKTKCVIYNAHSIIYLCEDVIIRARKVGANSCIAFYKVSFMLKFSYRRFTTNHDKLTRLNKLSNFAWKHLTYATHRCNQSNMVPYGHRNDHDQDDEAS